VKTVRKNESESRHGAQESPTLRKGERQRKNYGEIESEEKRDQNTRKRKKEERTESMM